MANANSSLITGRFRKMLGKELVFREWDGMTVVSKAPRSGKGRSSLAQQETRERFIMASRYACFVKNNPDQAMAKAYAAALRPRQNIYSRALEDYLKAPVVNDINVQAYSGAAGSRIQVNAVDDFRVAEVSVFIYTAGDRLLEKGFAAPNGVFWDYTARQANNALAGTKILVVATDLAGNKGRREIIL